MSLPVGVKFYQSVLSSLGHLSKDQVNKSKLNAHDLKGNFWWDMTITGTVGEKSVNSERERKDCSVAFLSKWGKGNKSRVLFQMTITTLFKSMRCYGIGLKFRKDR